MGEDAALWLTTARRLRVIGIDTASIDRGPSRDFRAHRVLTDVNVPIFENLAGLGALLPKRGTDAVSDGAGARRTAGLRLA